MINQDKQMTMEMEPDTRKSVNRAQMVRAIGSAVAFAAACLMGISAAGETVKATEPTTQAVLKTPVIQKIGINPSEFQLAQKQLIGGSSTSDEASKSSRDSEDKTEELSLAEQMAQSKADATSNTADKSADAKKKTEQPPVIVIGAKSTEAEKTAVADASDDARPIVPYEPKLEVISDSKAPKKEAVPVDNDNVTVDPVKTDEKMDDKATAKPEIKPETEVDPTEKTADKTAEKSDEKTPTRPEIKPETEVDPTEKTADKTAEKSVEKPELKAAEKPELKTDEIPDLATTTDKAEIKPLDPNAALTAVVPGNPTPKAYVKSEIPVEPTTATNTSNPKTLEQKQRVASTDQTLTSSDGNSANDNADSFVKVADTKSMKLSVHMNKSIVLETRTPYKRVSVGQPDIADVNLLGHTRILVTGKKTGTTQLLVWDDAEHPQVMDVVVAVDVAGLQEQVKKLFPNLKLDISAHNGEVILQGHVPSLEVLEQVKALSTSYGTKVNDLTVISGGQQVMLSVRFAEVSRSASSALGINLSGTDTKSFFGSNVGGVASAGTLSNAQGISSLIPGTPGAAVTIFGQGVVGKGAIQYFIDAMKQNNLLRILAEPNLLAISGQEATFKAGGAIPVPSSQGGVGNAAAVTVDYREYGVILKFVPIVLGDGRVRLKISPEISDLDWANSVTAGGFRIPGITLRKVSTTVELADGQTFAIAGLLNTSISASKNVTPLLGELPIIGPMFRTVQYSRKETEMVVLVTPHLVEAMNPLDVPSIPGENWDSPDDFNLFVKGRLGGEISKAGKPHRGAARFKGQYGFVPAESTQPPVQSPVVNTDKD